MEEWEGKHNVIILEPQKIREKNYKFLNIYFT